MAYFQKVPESLYGKIRDLYWPLIILIVLASLMGVLMLYSVADASWRPWAFVHAVRFLFFLCLMLVCALIPVRVWFVLAYPFYFFTLLLLLAVLFFGVESMGARRWLSFGGFRIQPSELMKISLILALARYYYDMSIDKVSSLKGLLIPFFMIGIPFLLILKQPDLGTAILFVFSACVIVFLAGLSWRIIGLLFLFVSLLIPSFMTFGLHDYQRQRILTFLDPERDPLGAGYHVLQSKIAIGSGGLTGKGFLQGTQSHLDFLPEKQTDFIFTIIAEEFGLVGGLGILFLYIFMILCCASMALSFKNSFARLGTMGVATNLVLYVLVNAAMVTGLAPVVGVPMPFLSYGGSVVMSMMVGFGFILSARIYRYSALPKTSVRF